MSTPPDRTPEEKAEIDAYKEKLQSLRFGQVPGGTREGKFVFRPKPNMSWEKGIQGEHRPDGSFMPYVRASDLSPITAKQMADNRGNFERQIRELRSGAAPPPPKD